LSKTSNSLVVSVELLLRRTTLIFSAEAIFKIISMFLPGAKPRRGTPAKNA
jgi:hypothetical protein